MIEHARIQALVVHLQVDGLGAAELDVRGMQQSLTRSLSVT